MIEKLDSKMEYAKISILGKEAECLDFAAGKKLNLKINELVDAVNELQKDREEIKEWIGIVSDLRSRVPVVESRVSILEEHAHPTAKTPVDPYKEQRKWIGCLCRFWDDDKDCFVFGILDDVDNDYQTLRSGVYFDSESAVWWEHCEPVKPDDDIIYKGGDNGL